MRFTSQPPAILGLVLALLVATCGLLPQRALAQDEQRFADLLAQRDGVTSLAGPLSGELAQEAGFSTVNGAGDFAVWPVSGDSETLLLSFATAPANGDENRLTPEPEASPAADSGSTSDQDAFAFLLESQEQATPLAGPLNANLKEEADRVAQSWAGVNLDAFQAHATFIVPPDSETPWDVGFIFGTSPNGAYRIVVDSAGNWFYAIGSGGPTERGTVTGLVTDVGGENTIDLFVAEQRAVFGVNGNFVSNIELPADSAAGDVAAGSAFFSDQTQPDRLITFRDFTILPFDPNELDVAEGSDSGPSAADQQAFANFLADAQSLAPSVGPFTGRLVEASPGTVPQAAAGISLADFGAVATFTNPDDLSTALWDAGFQFRAAGDQTHRVVLRSNGDVFTVLADGTTSVIGSATTYDATPGATNDVQLFVQDDRALIGVNGALAAAVALPEAPLASDILVGASFFNEDYVQGRVTAYEGFSVWETP